jgi:hypothetical protein
MGEDNKKLFRRILAEFVNRFEFALPNVGPAHTSAPAPAPAPAPQGTLAP